MMLARFTAAGRDGGGFLVEDTDLAVALTFQVDPFVVDHVWPVELRERAVAWMAASAKRQSKQSRGGR